MDKNWGVRIISNYQDKSRFLTSYYDINGSIQDPGCQGLKEAFGKHIAPRDTEHLVLCLILWSKIGGCANLKIDDKLWVESLRFANPDW